jgi:hypothetical protein
MSNVDLNIDNYDFNELLQLFNIKDDYRIKENIEKIYKKLKIIKTKYDSNIYKFYLKSCKIIECIYNLYEKNIILTLDDNNSISSYKKKVTKIDFFEDYDTSEIISSHLNIKTYDSVADVYSNTIYNKPPIKEKLNEPNYDIGKANPNLNNKNNTNLIANTFPNKIAPGNLNSIKRITQQQNLNLNSCFRDNYYNSKISNFHIDLPETFKKIVAIEFTAYTIPISIHSINSSNNYFLIKNNTTSVSSVIDISYGNYSTPCSNRIVSPADRNIKPVISGKLTTYDISYNIDVISGKSVFTNNSTTNTSYTLLFNTDSNKEFEERPLPVKLGWKLGFRYGEYILKAGESIMSEGIVDFDSPKYLYVSITDFTNSGTNNCSASAPGHPFIIPISNLSAHTCCNPARHRLHFWHPNIVSPVTRLPIHFLSTPSPTVETVPHHS